VPDNEPIKYMDIKEFREKGFLQEVNRLVLHPCGLAMEVMVHDDGTETLGGVWDYRGDPEGMCYANMDAGEVLDKASHVWLEASNHCRAREALFAPRIVVDVGETAFVVQTPDETSRTYPRRA
jgi:hypothetical protein